MGYQLKINGKSAEPNTITICLSKYTVYISSGSKLIFFCMPNLDKRT